MKKLIWGLVIVAVVAIFGGRAWYLNKQANTEKDVVKIGALVPLTGPTARDGADALSGMKIALNEVNQNPKYGFKLDLWVEDNKHSVPPTLSAFHKMNSSVPAFIIFGSVPTTGISSQLKLNKKPAVSLVNAEDGPIYTTPEVFRAWISINKQAGVISDFVKNNFKDKRIALFKIKAVEGDAFEKVLTEQLKEIGKDIVITETFSIPGSPFRQASRRCSGADLHNRRPGQYRRLPAHQVFHLHFSHALPSAVFLTSNLWHIHRLPGRGCIHQNSS